MNWNASGQGDEHRGGRVDRAEWTWEMLRHGQDRKGTMLLQDSTNVRTRQERRAYDVYDEMLREGDTKAQNHERPNDDQVRSFSICRKGENDTEAESDGREKRDNGRMRMMGDIYGESGNERPRRVVGLGGAWECFCEFCERGGLGPGLEGERRNGGTLLLRLRPRIWGVFGVVFGDHGRVNTQFTKNRQEGPGKEEARNDGGQREGRMGHEGRTGGRNGKERHAHEQE
ncbi:uncharacterized protein SPSK_10900 [Sporothrix schenckii 1099-18]|uniref:Uncharacterized protein n=1 Tax=Sporothrix schenckii 1099-18 TaxID=1397361 RepID=A0A0F2M7Y1_SPOSC|nr:uncharacterized protein SPSK_10900 [Sporothrix schenckii 1099-18]KJR85747.1 hypothetical protein SPSK_10900 [Sporothrix schenckii 1099-18]